MFNNPLHLQYRLSSLHFILHNFFPYAFYLKDKFISFISCVCVYQEMKNKMTQEEGGGTIFAK